MRRALYTTLAIAVSGTLLALVLFLAGPSETFGTLARLRGWQALVLVATAFGVSLFTAFAWQAILWRYGHDVPVWLLFRLTILAFAAGWAIPSGFVAGIPIAAWFLKRKGVPFTRGLASFTIGRFFEITAYAIVFPIVLLSGIGGRGLVAGLAVGMLALLTLIYLDLFLGWRLARSTLVALRGRLPRFAGPWVDRAVDFCRTVADFFAAPAWQILLVAFYSTLAIAVAFVRSVLTNDFLGVGLALPQIAVMFALTIFLMAVPFLPGAIGVYEGGIAGAFQLLGRSRAEGLAYAMAIHATELIVVAAGFIVLAQLGVGLFEAQEAEQRRSHAPRRRRARRAPRARAAR